MVPKRGVARARARRDELRKWRGVETDAGPIGARPRSHATAYSTATEACRSAHVGTTEFVATNSRRGGIIGCIAKCESCTDANSLSGYDPCGDDDSYAQSNDRRTSSSREHDVAWAHGTTHGRHDVKRLEVGHDKLVRSYELVANSFIVRRAEP
jgi:hypothetical protein